MWGLMIFLTNKLFLPPVLRITEASSTAHLDKIERGYENMDHYSVNFKKESQALRSIDFIQGDRVEI